MSTCNYTQPIFETECIGDSLPKINANFSNLDTGLCNITTTSNTQIPGLTSLKQQVQASTLFIPAQLATKSNSNIYLTNHNYGPASQTAPVPLTPFTNTNGLTGGAGERAWWSGPKTVTVTNCPLNTVGLLVEIDFNTNAAANNTIHLYIRKNSTEAAAFWPTGTGGDITRTQRNTLSADIDFLKIALDPVTTAHEAEKTATIVIYPESTANPTTKQFQYCFMDFKNYAPAGAPQFYVIMRLQGYYVEVT
jgi:hypothetical protein